MTALKIQYLKGEHNFSVCILNNLSLKKKSAFYLKKIRLVHLQITLTFLYYLSLETKPTVYEPLRDIVTSYVDHPILSFCKSLWFPITGSQFLPLRFSLFYLLISFLTF